MTKATDSLGPRMLLWHARATAKDAFSGVHSSLSERADIFAYILLNFFHSETIPPNLLLDSS